MEIAQCVACHEKLGDYEDALCKDCWLKWCWRDSLENPKIKKFMNHTEDEIQDDAIIWLRKRLEELEQIPKKEYWYYLVWTHKDDYPITKILENIRKLVVRAKKLGAFYIDISLEHGEEKGREHYNMRIKSYKMIPKNRFKHYEKYGSINYQAIHLHTLENWTNVGNYCKKENSIEILLDEKKCEGETQTL